MGATGGNEDDIIIEMKVFGRSVKVTAICCKTGDEVSIVGDAHAPKSQLEQLAARKLRYVQDKQRKA